MMWNEYPYSNVHELNLDWILNELKEITNEIDSLNNNFNDVVVTASATRGDETGVSVTGSLEEKELNFEFTLEQETPASTTTPLMDGVASVGDELEYARGNHRHPSDTNKQDKLIFDVNKGVANINNTLINKFSNLEDIDINDIDYNYRGHVIRGINTPLGVVNSGKLDVFQNYSSTYITQVYYPYNENRIFIRNKQVDVWSNWEEVGTGITFKDLIEGKKIVVVGDSLTAGNYQTDDKPWIEIIKDKYNCTIVNASVSSSPISKGGTSGSDKAIVDRAIATARANTDADIFIIEGGSNDFNYHVPLGGVNDTVKTTYCGAINYIINQVRNIIPSVKLLFMTQYHRYDTINNLNLGEIDYVNAMISCCSKKSIPCFNNWSNSGISLLDSDGMTWADAGFVASGTRNYHFSKKAYEYLADIYAPYIANGYVANAKSDYALSNYLLKGNTTNFNPTHTLGTIINNGKYLRFTIPCNKFIFASGVTFNTLFLTIRNVDGTILLNGVNVLENNVATVATVITASGITVAVTFTNPLTVTDGAPLAVHVQSSECVFS